MNKKNQKPNNYKQKTAKQENFNKIRRNHKQVNNKILKNNQFPNKLKNKFLVIKLL